MASTATKVGLKIHAAKTKVMKAKNKFRVPVTVEGEPLEEVKDFKYLGSYISSDSNIDKEVSTRIGLTAQAFKKLNNIWKSTTLSTKTKLRIYQSNVRSTLLCLRDVENQQEVGEQTSGLPREMFTENIES